MTTEDYIQQFLSMNTNKHLGQTAPHKAVMLLSVIDLVEDGKISQPSFELSENLENKFHEIWNRYIGASLLFRPVPATPFYHLSNEPFWTLYGSDGQKLSKMSSTPSIGFFRKHRIRAAINRNLFDLLQSPDNRARMRTALISGYLNRQKPDVMKLLPLVLSCAVARLCG